MEVKVININDCDIDRDKVVYIGRGSPLGNPWSHKKSKYKAKIVPTRDLAIEKYREWIHERLDDSSTSQYHAVEECVKTLIETGSLTLGCFCKPLSCHGDVLAEIIMELASDRANMFDNIFC